MPVRINFSSWAQPEFLRIGAVAWRRFPRWGFQSLAVQSGEILEAQSAFGQLLSRNIDRHTTYRSDVFFVKLWPNNGGLDEVFDICFAWESTQRWREGLSDMSVGVFGYFDFQPREV